MNNSYTQDYWLKAAKKSNYRARSVFKIKEIDTKYALIKCGHRVLDIGAYPGSWSQYASERVGTAGLVYAVDTRSLVIDSRNVVAMQYDATSPSFFQAIHNLSFHGIVSDMAPSTTGVKEVDVAASERLFDCAVSIVKNHLCSKGYVVIKYLHPQNLQRVKQRLSQWFNKVHIHKPASSRSNSTEVFVVGIHYLGIAQ